jgi:hypothetical protein
VYTTLLQGQVSYLPRNWGHHGRSLLLEGAKLVKRRPAHGENDDQNHLPVISNHLPATSNQLPVVVGDGPCQLYYNP